MIDLRKAVMKNAKLDEGIAFYTGDLEAIKRVKERQQILAELDETQKPTPTRASQ